MAEMFNPQNPEILELNRQRRMAELLTKQGFETPQGQTVAGGIYVPVNPLEQIASLYSVYAGKKKGEELDTKEQALAKALREKEQESTQNYMRALNPTNYELAGPTPSGAPLQTMNQVDYGKAFEAGTSPYASPQLKAAAYKLLEPITAKKDEIIQQRSFAPGGGMTTILEGQQSIPSGMESAQIALGLPRNPGTWTPAQRQAAMQYEFSLKNAGANRQNINVQNQLPFKEQIQKGMAEDLVKNYGNLKNASTEIKNLDKAIELSKSPAYLGSGAEAKLAITKLFNNNLGTNINADKVANTEELRSVLFQSTMENLKKVDAQPSQQQQAIMQQAFGTIGTDPSAIPKIVAVYKDILTNKVMEHNARVKESETGPAKIEYPYNIKVNLPETAKAPTTGALPNINYQSLDAILNSRGVK
jgi:hypothetical protein